MSSIREVAKLIHGQSTHDGAGVKLTRMFSRDEAALLDPFLMLDHFGSDRPEDYLAGFPMHPHRGIETVTYMLDGNVAHKDSLGNHGVIGPGDVQWMTAGSGILHEEMPQRAKGWMQGFQLWVNLPKANKMMPPRYRDLKKEDFPVFDLGNGSSIKVIAGESQGLVGPVKDLVVDVKYLDITLNSRTVLEHEVPAERNAFVFVYEGEMLVGDKDARTVPAGSVAVLGEGDSFRFTVGRRPTKFMFGSAKPLKEPIAWGGPIVMNTREELDHAFSDLKRGTFIK
ncbi:MAG TPA: pirin family protein [Methanomassiliicoccales archaeon]|nr:pirin family protein [Methanomassiliicoccales archaeon]HPR98937.1 pirin family protein [Methanomassiliicoccales archaeon]